MPLDAANYRAGLIETGILLLLLLLAFGAITVMARPRWLAMGVTESLLARLAAATLVASAAVGGLSGIVLSLVQGSAFADTTLSPTASRNQAVLGVGVGLGITIVGILRIGQVSRGLRNPTPPGKG